MVGITWSWVSRILKKNIKDIVEGSHKFLSNLVAKIGFGVEMVNFVKGRVCSNYFEVDIRNLEIVN